MKDTFYKRTHTCGVLKTSDIGKTVILNGWVDNWRDHGGIRFIDLRDRYGITQIVFDLSKDPETHGMAKELRKEFVLAAKGKVEPRPEDMVNKNLKTGEIEIHAEDIQILNESKVTPFSISDTVEIAEELRLKWRYLDLRKESMQKNMILRHKCYQSVRNYFDEKGFVEIETPMLMKSTPEGARDYLVPSRMFPGNFYALPQSPQTYKQILMIAGMDKYIQIVRCFRDEDLRADRQPEFTQIDLEMSFIDEEDIYSVIDEMFERLMYEVLGITISIPIRRMSYNSAIEKYGIDKPDTRWEMELVDISDIAEHTDFKIFSETVKQGGIVSGIVLKKEAGISRKMVDDITEFATAEGAKGLVTLKINEDGFQGPVAKFLAKDHSDKIMEKMSAETDDIVFLIADERKTTLEVLGKLRLELIRRFELPPKEKFSFTWVTEFPLFEYDKDSGRYISTHHPFTSPVLEDLEYLKKDTAKVRSRAYDIVMNGYELGSGSIRIHKRDVQEKVFDALGIDQETARKKFGFLLDAFEFGAPPHGGIALGLDRIVMLMAEKKSIREVIAFPKTNKAFCPMVETPSEIEKEQLEELGLLIPRPKKTKTL
jgi:aspartyl-tRNA synthetase